MTRHARRVQTLPQAKEQRRRWQPALDGAMYIRAMVDPSKSSIPDPTYKIEMKSTEQSNPEDDASQLSLRR